MNWRRSSSSSSQQGQQQKTLFITSDDSYSFTGGVDDSLKGLITTILSSSLERSLHHCNLNKKNSAEEKFRKKKKQNIDTSFHGVNPRHLYFLKIGVDWGCSLSRN